LAYQYQEESLSVSEKQEYLLKLSCMYQKEYVTGYEYHLHYGHPEEKRNTNVESWEAKVPEFRLMENTHWMTNADF